MIVTPDGQINSCEIESFHPTHSADFAVRKRSMTVRVNVCSNYWQLLN